MKGDKRRKKESHRGSSVGHRGHAVNPFIHTVLHVGTVTQNFKSTFSVINQIYIWKWSNHQATQSHCAIWVPIFHTSIHIILIYIPPLSSPSQAADNVVSSLCFYSQAFCLNILYNILISI